MPVRPIATGLIFCDLVIVDQKTRNAMVNGHGSMPAKLVIERLDTSEYTYEREFSVSFADTLQELMGIFRVRAHYIPVHGVYHAMLIVDGESIAQKRKAKEAQRHPQDPETPS